MLRYDGLYVSEPIHDDWDEGICYEYLRFYEDGTVLAVFSNEHSPNDVIRWLSKSSDVKWISKGQYNVQGNTIRFSATSPDGTIDYAGQIINDCLELRWHSHITCEKGFCYYSFIEVS